MQGLELGMVAAGVRQTAYAKETGHGKRMKDVSEDLHPGDCFLDPRTMSLVSPVPCAVPKTPWKE